jgi:hypothetical protein
MLRPRVFARYALERLTPPLQSLTLSFETILRFLTQFSKIEEFFSIESNDRLSGNFCIASQV